MSIWKFDKIFHILPRAARLSTTVCESSFHSDGRPHEAATILAAAGAMVEAAAAAGAVAARLPQQAAWVAPHCCVQWAPGVGLGALLSGSGAGWEMLCWPGVRIVTSKSRKLG